MIKIKLLKHLLITILLSVITIFQVRGQTNLDNLIESYTVDLKQKNLCFFLKDISGKYFNNHGRLSKYLDSLNMNLIFAINGGMYKKDHSPQGLYIEDCKIISNIETIQKG